MSQRHSPTMCSGCHTRFLQCRETSAMLRVPLVGCSLRRSHERGKAAARASGGKHGSGRGGQRGCVGRSVAAEGSGARGALGQRESYDCQQQGGSWRQALMCLLADLGLLHHHHRHHQHQLLLQRAALVPCPLFGSGTRVRARAGSSSVHPAPVHGLRSTLPPRRRPWRRGRGSTPH